MDQKINQTGNNSLSIPIHRSRFLDVNPHSISALAFPPPPTDTRDKEWLGFGVLAVGKSNGDIELKHYVNTATHSQLSVKKQPAGKGWVLDKTLPAHAPAGKIHSLHFTRRNPPPKSAGTYTQAISSINPYTSKHLRLFSSSGTNTVIEWDINTGKILNKLSSDGGAIWSMTTSPSTNSLALGCADGRIRLVDLSSNQLVISRVLAHVPTRLLSVAWCRSAHADASNDEYDEQKDGWVVAGCSDSSLRVYSLENGRVNDRLAVDKTNHEHTLIWSVNVLQDDTIVSGDSLGNVIFWDKQSSSQISSFRAHEADVLTTCVSSDGKTVFTGGIDQRVSQFTKVSVSEDRLDTKFFQSGSRRIHTHDINAIAVWPPQGTATSSALSSQVPVVVSGGIDPHMILTPGGIPLNRKVKEKQLEISMVNPVSTSKAVTFADSWHKRSPYVPLNGRNTVSVCRARRWIIARRDNGISVWRLKSSDEDYGEGGYDKVLDTEFKFRTHLISHAVSPNGQVLAVSDAYETKLFTLADNGPPIPKKVKLQEPLAGAQYIEFTPDSRRIIMALSGASSVLVYELDQGQPTLLKEWTNKTTSARSIRRMPDRKSAASSMDVDSESEDEDGDKLEASVHTLACSRDGQWLVIADYACNIQIYNLDSMQHHATLPSLSELPASIQFHPLHQSLLIIALPNCMLTFYDVEKKASPAWSKRLNVASMPESYVQLLDPLQGIILNPDPTTLPPQFHDNSSSTLDPHSDSKLIAYGASWMCVIKYMTAEANGNNASQKLSKNNKRKMTKHDRNKLAADVANVRKQMGEAANGIVFQEDEILKHAEESSFYKMVNRYQPIACADYIAPSELIVVERPQADFVADLPPAFYKHRYGRS
ncbi:hypothetical protein E3P99_03164 [Wallemia hederae]|uniref:Uncharacterized protein n=1 Tax=Wallemia hederae TaxID=1540922 RepID=A0A4V4LSR5_9BASI|nr:hypothetical protein E3P99_03164 [Wallemia hederae]